jgi:hypothetical protein
MVSPKAAEYTQLGMVAVFSQYMAALFSQYWMHLLRFSSTRSKAGSLLEPSEVPFGGLLASPSNQFASKEERHCYAFAPSTPVTSGTWSGRAGRNRSAGVFQVVQAKKAEGRKGFEVVEQCSPEGRVTSSTHQNCSLSNLFAETKSHSFSRDFASNEKRHTVCTLFSFCS